MSDSHLLSVLSAAREAPSRIALVWQGNALTYADLEKHVTPMIAAIDANRLDTSTRVALWSSNRLRTALAIFAFIERGVPIVPIHPRLLAAEAERLARASHPAKTMMDDDLDAFAMEPSGPLAPRGIDAQATLAMLFTSGSSGTPKGALLSRSAFLAAARASAENLGWQEDDRWLLTMPLCHVGGLSILTRALVARRCVILHARFDANAVLESIERDRATILSVVPTMLRQLLDADTKGVLPRLRAILVGGAATPRALLEQCASRQIRALTTYGLTEACSQVTSQRPRDPSVVELGSGHALKGIDVTILGEDGASLSPGEIGKIHISGPTLMSGYFGREEERAASFDTGDLGALDTNGVLHVHARRTDLIVSGGENIYPAEVEEVLETVAGVKRALVFGVADETWGEVVAVAIERDPGRGDDASIKAAVSTLLAPHKRPRLVCFVDAIPLVAGDGASAKVDRARGRTELTSKTKAW